MARCRAMQAIYQWHHTDQSGDILIKQFIDDSKNMGDAEIAYFKALVNGTIKHINSIDETMRPFLDRRIDQLNPVELAVLRLAVYEFLYCPDVPYRVVINEALEIVKRYGSIDGYKYVNGVLDAIAPKVRTLEKKH